MTRLRPPLPAAKPLSPVGPRIVMRLRFYTIRPFQLGYAHLWPIADAEEIEEERLAPADVVLRVESCFQRLSACIDTPIVVVGDEAERQAVVAAEVAPGGGEAPRSLAYLHPERAFTARRLRAMRSPPPPTSSELVPRGSAARNLDRSTPVGASR